MQRSPVSLDTTTEVVRIKKEKYVSPYSQAAMGRNSIQNLSNSSFCKRENSSFSEHKMDVSPSSKIYNKRELQITPESNSPLKSPNLDDVKRRLNERKANRKLQLQRAIAPNFSAEKDKNKDRIQILMQRY